MRKVIAVGQSCIDIVHVDYKPVMSYVGGRIANMAASLSRAGVPVEYVSECGQDSVGDMIIDFLQSNGVGTKSVDRFTEGLSPISLIFRDAEGRERYSEYVKYPKTRFDILWPKIEEDDIVVFGSYFSIDENVRKPLSEFLAYAQERKALLVYLPGFQPELCSRITRVMPYIFENFIVYRYEKLGFFTRLIPSDTVFSKIYKDGKFLDGAEEYLNKLINKRYKDYGFMSTTMIRNSVFQDRVVELRIKAPRLSKAVFVSIKDLAAFDSQYELLFPRGKILSLESYEISSDRKNITINVKMQPPCLYSRSCDEIYVDNLRQPEFDLQPAKKVDDDNKIGSPYQRF